MDRCGVTFQWSETYHPLTRDMERSGGRITSISFAGKKIKNHCCYRETISGSDKCYWHTKTEKSGRELAQKMRTVEEPIGNIHLKGDFKNIDISGIFPEATFEDSYFQEVDLSEAIIPNAYFTKIDLNNSNFDKTVLQGSTLTNISNSERSEVSFRQSDLRGVTFLNADFEGGDFESAVFNERSNIEGDTDITGANFREADLEEVKWENIDLSESDLTRANVQNADFTDATLVQTVFSHANCRGADFSAADIEGAQFDQAYLVGSDFTDAEFHNAVLSDVQIDHTTKFDDVSSYQRDDAPPGKLETRPVRDLKALWTYRTLQTVFRENGMIDKARKYYIKEKDLRRKQYWEQYRGNPTLLEDQDHFLKVSLQRRPRLKRGVFLFRAIRAESSKWVMKFGEGFANLAIASVIIVSIFGFLYPFFGIETSTEKYRFSWPASIGDLSDQSLQPFLDGLLLSVQTFTPGTSSNIEPIGLSQVMVIIESSLGTIFLALVVFVLGRRTTR
ncbi:pentapeptide repeat-containing protein [Natrialbaceae archaeon A-gly3]